MKVFRMNDCDWVAAETLPEACEFYKEHCSLGDEDIDGPGELTDEEMAEHEFYPEGNGEGTPRSFSTELAHRLLDGVSFPCFFASTEH